MTGHLRITHEQRGRASQMPGVAAWVWFELLAWHGAIVTRGRLLDASGADSLRTVERALTYLESQGLAARVATGWASVDAPTDETAMATPARHDSAKNGDSIGVSNVTKLSHGKPAQSCATRESALPKETKDTKDTNTSSLCSEVKPASVKSFDPTKLKFPNRLESIPEFAAIWLEWVTHRREIRKPLTPTSVKQQLEMLEAHPDPVACIRASLQGGYAGVFPERGLPAKSATQSSTSLTPRNGVNDKNYWAKVQLDHDAKVEAIINGSMA